MEVLGLSPTVVELEEAAAWMEGQGDILSREGRPQSAKVAAMLDILEADEDEDERRR